MQFYRKTLVPLIILATMTIVASAGCHRSDRCPLTGEVTLDGKPLAGATISFQPAPGSTGGTSGGLLDDSGCFSIPAQNGLISGKYAVSIQKWIGTGRFRIDVDSGKPIEITAPIPFKEDGILDVAITNEGPNQFEFHLTTAK